MIPDTPCGRPGLVEQRRVERLGGGAVGEGYGVRVARHRDDGRGVPEPHLHGLDVHAVGYEQHGVRVPKQIQTFGFAEISQPR